MRFSTTLIQQACQVWYGRFCCCKIYLFMCRLVYTQACNSSCIVFCSILIEPWFMHRMFTWLLKQSMQEQIVSTPLTNFLTRIPFKICVPKNIDSMISVKKNLEFGIRMTVVSENTNRELWRSNVLSFQIQTALPENRVITQERTPTMNDDMTIYRRELARI